METIKAWNPPVQLVKEWIEKAGTTIGSVYFTKRSNGELRKMSYRLHVTKPSVANPPKGTIKAKILEESDKKICKICGSKYCFVGPWQNDTKINSKKLDKKAINDANKLITVLDCNKVVRDETGSIKGRGAWRSVPLDSVTRIKNKEVQVDIYYY